MLHSPITLDLLYIQPNVHASWTPQLVFNLHTILPYMERCISCYYRGSLNIPPPHSLRWITLSPRLLGRACMITLAAGRVHRSQRTCGICISNFQVPYQGMGSRSRLSSNGGWSCQLETVGTCLHVFISLQQAGSSRRCGPAASVIPLSPVQMSCELDYVFSSIEFLNASYRASDS